MGNTRKLVVVWMTAAALVGSVAASTASANNGQGKGRDKLIQLQVLSFNDYHGYLEAPTGGDNTLGAALDPTLTPVGGSEFLSSKLTELRASARNSVTVAAGDLIGGSTFLSGLFHDEPSVESLEAMKLDVSGVGNHEFDEGLDELYRMQNGGCHPVEGCYFPEAPYDGADFPWLAANVTFDDTGKTVLPPTWTKVVEGVKVGFIGMTLEGTPELVSAVGIQGLSFNDEVESANAAAAQLRRNNVSSIVVLLHEGGAQAGTYNQCTGISGPVVEIAENLDPAIDLVVTGHTHQPYVCTIDDPAGNPRQVTSASSFGRVVTETTLTINKFTRDVVRSATVSQNHLVARVNPDPALTAIIQKWKTIGDPIGNRVIGEITEDITNPGNRTQETAMQNLVADGLLAATAAPENGGAQIAVVNPGGVRASLSFAPPPGSTQQPGDVTYAEAYAVQPFGNFLVTMDLTGAQLKSMLEQQFFARGTRPQLVLGVSDGLTFDWLQSQSVPQGSRVANLKFMGVPVEDGVIYRVATNNFLADGGDGFTVFRDGANRISGVLDADGQVVDDLDALVNYISANSPLSSPGTSRINEVL